MSPRAGSRLVSLGFPSVHDYVAGKVDWLAHGLPCEGSLAGVPTAGTRMRSDVATARLDEPVGDVRDRVDASRHGFALVLDDDGVLLGRLRRVALDADPRAVAAAVMEPGPATIRPHKPAAQVVEGLTARGQLSRIVTDPSGRLLGVVHRDDVVG